jgi:hypothetical protein
LQHAIQDRTVVVVVGFQERRDRHELLAAKAGNGAQARAHQGLDFVREFVRLLLIGEDLAASVVDGRGPADRELFAAVIAPFGGVDDDVFSFRGGFPFHVQIAKVD